MALFGSRNKQRKIKEKRIGVPNWRPKEHDLIARADSVTDAITKSIPYKLNGVYHWFFCLNYPLSKIGGPMACDKICKSKNGAVCLAACFTCDDCKIFTTSDPLGTRNEKLVKGLFEQYLPEDDGIL